MIYVDYFSIKLEKNIYMKKEKIPFSQYMPSFGLGDRVTLDCKSRAENERESKTFSQVRRHIYKDSFEHIYRNILHIYMFIYI